MISPATALNLACGMMVVWLAHRSQNSPTCSASQAVNATHEPAQALDQPHHVVGWITTRASRCASVFQWLRTGQQRLRS